ncbi:MAG: CopG family transcriptional regulator [Nitrospirota bacterium]
MARLTITLPKPRHLALKEAAARRGKTIGQLIEESLDFYGITPSEHAWTLVEKARARSGLSEREAINLAVGETLRVRQTTRKTRRHK